MQEFRSDKDKRSIAKVDLSARLLLVDGAVLDVALMDLSYGGCRIAEPQQQLKRNDPVGVELPGLTEFTIGRIAWSDQGQIGIKFEKPLFEPVFRYLRDKLFGIDQAA